MYRPKGWEKTLREILDRFDVTYMNSEECQLIEAGADAMLKALRESNEPSCFEFFVTGIDGWDRLSHMGQSSLVRQS